MLTTCLWSSGNNALEMAEFYCRVFPRSEITSRIYHDEPNAYNPDIKAGDIMLVEFTLLGEDKFMTLNGGPIFQPSGAASWVITCEDQRELDHYYDHLSAKTESEVCGWIQDKFGVSWQLVPRNYTDYVMHGERSKIINMNRKILTMNRLTWDAIEKAYNN